MSHVSFGGQSGSSYSAWVRGGFVTLWAQAGFSPPPSHPITWVGGVDHVVVTRRSDAGPALRATLGIRYGGKGRSVNRVL